MRRTIFRIFGLLGFFGMLTGCGARAPMEASAKMAAPSPLGVAAAPGDVLDGKVMKDLAGEQAPEAPAQAQERKLIRTSQVDLQVTDLAPVEGLLRKKVEAVKGFIASTSLDTYQFTAQIRVPVEAFDGFLGQAGDLGKVLSKSTQTQDVTAQHTDLATRLKNKKILVQRFQDYLNQTKSIEDIMKVERQLSEITSEMEALEGSFKNLDRQVVFSSITMTFRVPSSSQSYQAPSFLDDLWTLGKNVGEFFYGLLFALIYLLLIGGPLGLVGWILWKLIWGKKGWVKRRKAQMAAGTESSSTQKNGGDHGSNG